MEFLIETILSGLMAGVMYSLVALGLLTYTGLVIAGLVGEQYYAAGFAAIVLPFLLVRAIHVARKAFCPTCCSGSSAVTRTIQDV